MGLQSDAKQSILNVVFEVFELVVATSEALEDRPGILRFMKDGARLYRTPAFSASLMITSETQSFF